MQIELHSDNPKYATKHPSNLATGDVYTDSVRGEPVDVLVLRDAKRIRGTEFYRVYGFVLAENRFTGFKVHEDTTVAVHHRYDTLELSFPDGVRVEGVDPMIAERDAALEAINNDDAFGGDQFQNDEERTED